MDIENGISHGVEDGNDFTDRAVTRRDRLLLVIGVHDHISKIHVGEHDLIGCEQDSHRSDDWVPIDGLTDQGEYTIGDEYWMSTE